METIKKPFQLFHIFSQARAHLSGTKGALWAPTLVAIVLSAITGFIITAIFHKALGFSDDLNAQHPFSAFIMQLINAFIVAIVIAPFLTGMLMVAIRRARGETLEKYAGFRYMRAWVKLATINFVITIFALAIDLFFSMVMVLLLRAVRQHMPPDMAMHYGNGFVIGIAVIMFLCYLLFYAFVVFAMPSAIDKDKSAWDAICTGARIVLPHWLRMLGLEIIVTIIIAITLLPFSLASIANLTWLNVVCGLITVGLLIWALPYILLVHGEAYNQLADSSGKA